jgi:hypothetical protein
MRRPVEGSAQDSDLNPAYEKAGLRSEYRLEHALLSVSTRLIRSRLGLLRSYAASWISSTVKSELAIRQGVAGRQGSTIRHPPWVFIAT